MELSHTVSNPWSWNSKTRKKDTLMLFSFQPGGARTKHLCVYWEGSQEGGSWSTEGCTLVGSNDSYTVCKCFHLSSFAVLVALVPEVPRPMVPSDCVQEAGRSPALCLRKRLLICGVKLTWKVISGSTRRGLGKWNRKRIEAMQRASSSQIPL